MSIDATGDVGGVQGPQGPKAAESAAQLRQQRAITIEVFAVLMSILGQFSQGVNGTLMPQIEQEKVWENAAAGLATILTVNPGVPPKFAGSHLTNHEINQFANGWQTMAYAYSHQNGKMWKSLPSNIKGWISGIMKNPSFAAGFNKLYQGIKKLQQLENQKAPKSEITAQRNKVLGDVNAIQALKNSKDPKVALAFKLLLSQTQSIQQEMSGLSSVLVAKAMRAVKFIKALTQTISLMIKHVETVKQKMASAGIS